MARVAKKAQTGGGRLNRSETVTVRLDPRLNYLCELAARAQRRTKSSFIEWAVEQALGSVVVPDSAGGWDSTPQNLADLSRQLWSVDEAERLIALAFRAPLLMDHDEQVLWRAIRANGWFWRGRYIGVTNEGLENFVYEPTEDNLIDERLRDRFHELKAFVLHNDPNATVPGWERTRLIKTANGKPGTQFSVDFENLPDDVPF